MSTAGTPSRRRTAALLVRLLIPGLLVLFGRRASLPAALGIPYERGAR